MENLVVEERVRIFGGDYTPPDMKLLLKLEALIEANFREIRGLDFYTDQLGISAYRLNELTKFYKRKTVYLMLLDRFYEEAEKLLKYTAMSTKEIAFELNCCDAAYFSNCFKKHSGMSTKAY